jgi:hypothetical protein
MKRTAAAILGLVVVPLAAYAGLLAWLDARGGATLMLGAAAGSSAWAIAAMAAALLLRLYTVLVLPGVVVASVVLRVASLVKLRR